MRLSMNCATVWVSDRMHGWFKSVIHPTLIDRCPIHIGFVVVRTRTVNSSSCLRSNWLDNIKLWLIGLGLTTSAVSNIPLCLFCGWRSPILVPTMVYIICMSLCIFQGTLSWWRLWQIMGKGQSKIIRKSRHIFTQHQKLLAYSFQLLIIIVYARPK